MATQRAKSPKSSNYSFFGTIKHKFDLVEKWNKYLGNLKIMDGDNWSGSSACFR